VHSVRFFALSWNFQASRPGLAEKRKKTTREQICEGVCPPIHSLGQNRGVILQEALFEHLVRDVDTLHVVCADSSGVHISVAVAEILANSLKWAFCSVLVQICALRYGPISIPRLSNTFQNVVWFSTTHPGGQPLGSVFRPARILNTIL
jgi:hypothetical protein